MPDWDEISFMDCCDIRDPVLLPNFYISCEFKVIANQRTNSEFQAELHYPLNYNRYEKSVDKVQFLST